MAQNIGGLIARMTLLLAQREERTLTNWREVIVSYLHLIGREEKEYPINFNYARRSFAMMVSYYSFTNLRCRNFWSLGFILELLTEEEQITFQVTVEKFDHHQRSKYGPR